MNEPIKSKNSRSLRNLRFMEGRLRLAFGAMTLGLVVSTIVLGSVMGTLNTSLRNLQTTEPSLAEFVTQVQSGISTVLLISIVCNVSSAVMALGFGLMIGHRFYGPMVPLTRHLRELKDGSYSSRVRLRPGDELVQLMNAQNELAEALETKFGKS